MLRSIFPLAHAHFTSMPIVGEFIEGLCVWLHAQGHSRGQIRRQVQAAPALSRALRRRRVLSLRELTAAGLREFVPPASLTRTYPPVGLLVRSLARYLVDRGEFAPTPVTRTQRLAAEYGAYLERVRGIESIRHHIRTATQFLDSIDYEARPRRLRSLCSADFEAFIAKTSQRVGRIMLAYVAGDLRSFLRFLAVRGEVPMGLDAQVDMPRIWRRERLPRAMPWETVQAFLRSIDRSTPMGRRDYAMFLLIATYGLRAGEVAALELDDVAWRARQIRVPRPKIGTSLLLPLTAEVGAALVDYLQRGRPRTGSRRIFHKLITPPGPVHAHTIASAVRWWARRAGIKKPALGGTHCLRHSVAVHLLRNGAGLKTIGDLLGHRLLHSTGTYLRLQVDDLRDVALPLPSAAVAGEVRP